MIAFFTLYKKEVQRFFKVIMQTLLAPVVTTLLYLAVFQLALGRGGNMIGNLSFPLFLAPGLIMMTILQNSFANSSSSLIIGKVNGNIVDVLLPPLSPMTLTAGYALGAMTRGVLSGLMVATSMMFFLPLTIHHPMLVIYYVLSGAAMLAMLGILAGIWAEKFDHLATITNFVITPLSFLSGTFYSIRNLPPMWEWVALYNPFFYVIDGLRYAMTNHSDGNVQVGIFVLLTVNALLCLLCLHVFSSGYKLKA